MRALSVLLVVAGLVVAAAILSGCSGTGVTASAVRGDTVRTAAENHVTAVHLVKNWSPILHWRQAQTEQSSTFELEFLPDGSVHQWGVNSDGTLTDYVTLPDGSGSGTQTRTDGAQDSIAWDAEVVTDETVTSHITETFYNAVQMSYSTVLYYNELDGRQAWDGSATLPDGRTMSFHLDRALDAPDRLVLTLSDRARLSWSVPTGGVEGSAWWPRFDQGATGVYTDAAGARLQFRMTGSGDRWDRWETTAPDGLRGSFVLNPDLDGSGGLRRNGQVIGALDWLPTAFGTLSLAEATRAEVAPSAAARDFHLDQWLRTGAAMGPAPIY